MSSLNFQTLSEHIASHKISRVSEIRKVQRSVLAMSSALSSFSNFVPKVVVDRIIQEQPGADRLYAGE